jgi:hypothetical protein
MIGNIGESKKLCCSVGYSHRSQPKKLSALTRLRGQRFIVNVIMAVKKQNLDIELL